MIRITCQSCGKTYDYMKDDLCPRCGAYNNPTDRQRAEISSLIRRKHGLKECTPDCMPAGFGGHRDIDRDPRRSASAPVPYGRASSGSYGRPASPSGYTAGGSYSGGRPAVHRSTGSTPDIGGGEREYKSVNPKLIAIIAAAAALVICIAVTVIVLSARPTPSEMEILSFAPGESFAFGKYSLFVGSCRELPELEWVAVPEGKKLIGIELTSGGERGSSGNQDFEEPYIRVGSEYFTTLGYETIDWDTAESIGMRSTYFPSMFGYGGESGWVFFMVDEDCGEITFCAEVRRNDKVKSICEVDLAVEGRA